MKPELRNPFESALVAAVVAAAFLWMLVSSAQQDPTPVARVVLFSVGLAASIGVHFAFVMQLVRRTGRSVALWFTALLLVPVLSSAILLVQVASDPADTGGN